MQENYLYCMMPSYDALEIPDQFRTTSINREEGEFIYSLLKKNGLRRTLEVGFGYGCSAAYIIAATQAKHIVIDPYQHAFGNLGLKNIEKLGFSQYLVHRKEKSYAALCQLLGVGISLEFAFIDGDHRFDTSFVDFYLIDLMLDIRGYVIFDDAWMRPIQLVRSFVDANRKDYLRIKECPQNFIVYQRIGRDERTWYHFEEFYTDKGKDYYQKFLKDLDKDPSKGIRELQLQS
jgi:predicted O-methyltransferase YrrM